MKFTKDTELTLGQQKLKWYVYCDLDMEDDADVEAVLSSLLKDVLSAKQAETDEERQMGLLSKKIKNRKTNQER